MWPALSAELYKLRTLPITVFATIGTVGIGVLIAAAYAAISLDESAPTSAAATALSAVPFVQAGVIVVGVLSVSQEYAGRQLRSTLLAGPRRWRVAAAKTIAAAGVAAIVATAAVGGAGVTAALMLPGDRGTGAEAARLGGAVLYLTLIGLLAHSLALLLRQLVPALIAMLVLVFILPPALGSLGEHVRWLPDQAGGQLFAPDDAVLTPLTGALTLGAWIVVVGFGGALRFVHADASVG